MGSIENIEKNIERIADALETIAKQGKGLSKPGKVKTDLIVIADIYYNSETDDAVLFISDVGGKVLWLPKKVIRGGYSTDGLKKQSVKIFKTFKYEWRDPP